MKISLKYKDFWYFWFIKWYNLGHFDYNFGTFRSFGLFDV
jgi:hypothetical protein